MSFELSVVCKNGIPSDLREALPERLKAHNITCEIHPDFSPESWNGGFLPFKVDLMPKKLIGEDLKSPAISGFEIDFDDDMVFFRSAMGRTATEFALLCLSAAEITSITDGELHDHQSGEVYTKDTVLKAANKEIQETLSYDGVALRQQHLFKGWDAEETLEESTDEIAEASNVSELKKPWWQFWKRDRS